MPRGEGRTSPGEKLTSRGDDLSPPCEKLAPRAENLAPRPEADAAQGVRKAARQVPGPARVEAGFGQGVPDRWARWGWARLRLSTLRPADAPQDADFSGRLQVIVAVSRELRQVYQPAPHRCRIVPPSPTAKTLLVELPQTPSSGIAVPVSTGVHEEPL